MGNRQWQSVGTQVPRGGNGLTRWLGRTLLRLMGWRLCGEIPNRPKLIIAVAPHTSNIDWVLSAAVIWALGLKASYLAKHSLFRFPLGIVMRFFGGIPVDRGSASGMVAQMATHFAENPQLILGITPEGTRQGEGRWRKGFALIAQAANVPVLPTIVNYDTKVVVFDTLIEDVEDADITLVKVQQAAAAGVGRAS